MKYLLRRRRLKALLEKARSGQPLRTSAEAYAGMERMQELTNGMSPFISGNSSVLGLNPKG